MTALLIGVVIGIVLKILVPMPFLDNPVLMAWRWMRDNIRLK